MLNTTRRAIILLMCAALTSPGCATTGAVGSARRPVRTAAADASVLLEYVQSLPPGSLVRVERANGRTLRGILMKATAGSLIVQPRTRIPEPPVEVALTEVLSVTPESPNGHNLVKAVALGAAAGAGAALTVFVILLTIYSD
jgi:hypothetical protein